MKLINGDCLEILKDIADNSVDAIVTDPPYELGFMGKSWDSTGIANNVELWKECLRVLKPGGHLLAFSGTRTYHRMAGAIEDAGFEVRDMIEWVYGVGFPKSLNIGKAVDKIAPRLGQFDEFAKHLTEQIKKSKKSQKEIAALFPSKSGGLTGCVWNWANGANVPTVAQWNVLKPLLNLSDEFLPLIERIEREREVVGKDKKADLKEHVFFGDINKAQEKGKAIGYGEWDITKGTSEWEGWGTALKPAHEPICMARKPLSEKTVAENCLKWGTGGINIDESRVEYNDGTTAEDIKRKYTGSDEGNDSVTNNFGVKEIKMTSESTPLGRFPANLIHDNSEEVKECFPDSVDNGNASRFFKSIIYEPKADGLDRGIYNKHPTVKPVALMEYLIKMISRDNATILDPFMGSGSTALAAVRNGREFIGIELSKEYFEMTEARLLEKVGLLIK